MAATLKYMSLDRSDVRYAAKEICTKMARPDTGKLEEVEEGTQIREGSREADVGEGGVGTRRYDRGCARGFGLGKRARKDVDERRHDDGQQHSGETQVENVGFVCAEHGGSRIPARSSRNWLKVSECSR